MTKGDAIVSDADKSMDDSVDAATLAGLGGRTLLEIKADRRLSRQRRIDAYLTEGKEKFLLDPKRRTFSLREQHFGKPRDFELALIPEPSEWFNAVLAALSLSLAPPRSAD